jgi:hypothetical protein
MLFARLRYEYGSDRFRQSIPIAWTGIRSCNKRLTRERGLLVGANDYGEFWVVKRNPLTKGAIYAGGNEVKRRGSWLIEVVSD